MARPLRYPDVPRYGDSPDRAFRAGRSLRQSIHEACRKSKVTSTDLNGYVECPGLAQVFRPSRIWGEHGTTKRALHYGITSLTPQTGPPERLLARERGHWIIENGLHRVKDVSLGEDQ